MCVIVDVNILGGVFDKNHSRFEDYEPIKKWVLEGKGKLVVGGSKYGEELKRVERYAKLIAELAKLGKVVVLKKQNVDNHQVVIEGKEKDPDFDDPHLIAMVVESGVRILCSDDKRADKFIKKRKFYPKGKKPPIIYRNKRHHARFLRDDNVVLVCMPKKPLTKEQKSKFDAIASNLVKKK
ncbi:MAG: hypothetical protein ACPGVB_08940 [Chitinophagales bacterium]